MSELTKFRDHARSMAGDGHTPKCIERLDKAKSNWGYFCMFREWPEGWGERPSGPPKPCAGDCVTEAERALWTKLADEVDEHLAERVEVDLFGETSTEPTTTGPAGAGGEGESS